jgi:UDP-glucose 4-epimerase
MRVLVTGGSGYVGRFIIEELRSGGHEVTLLGRTALTGYAYHAWSLAKPGDVPAADALVHAAFDHVPGAYRGGEGCDPAGFMRLNRDGSRALFEAALARGIHRWVFLSSRAVYGDHRRGEILRESDIARPDSLYGEMKHSTELEMARLAGQSVAASILRATGVYGRAHGDPGHKWHDLFNEFFRGTAIAPRIGSELHGQDLARAVLMLLETGREAAADTFNVSDILLDRSDLLERVRLRTGAACPLPARYEGPMPGVLATDRLEALGWRPGGFARLEAFLEELFPQSGADHQTSGAQPIQSP